MSRTLAYRRASPGDIPALRSLHRAALGALGAAHYSPRQIAGLFLTRETVDPVLVADGTSFLAEAGGRIVGSAAWTRRRGAGTGRRGVETGVVGPVFVAPDWTRRGIGRALMDIVELDAVLHGGAIRLELVSTLAGAEFARALGYSFEKGEQIPLANGGSFAAVRLVKEILPSGAVPLAA